jgi:hypothetical protein
MGRRLFIQQLGVVSAAALFPCMVMGEDDHVSAFAKKLKPVGRTLEMDGYYVWCNSPIEGPDGKIHVFFSRWVASKNGWMDKRLRDMPCHR